MEKFYNRINWQNKPSLATPLGATNLNKMDSALEELDNRTLELNRKNNTHDRILNDLQAESNEHTQNIVNLQTQTESITQNIDSFKIVSTASGSPVYMEDSSNMNFENIVFYGECKQESTSGKNLLSFPYYSALPYTTQGVTFTSDEKGVVNVNGTSTGDAFIDLYYNENEMLTTEPIIFSKGEGGNSTLLYFERIGGKWVQQRDVASQTTITPSAEATGQIFRITLKNGRTANNEKCYPMVRLASNTDSTWEKYTGGKASPNPDYPQPIESKVVNQIDVSGKNFLDCSGLTEKTVSGVKFTPVFENGMLQYVSVEGTPTENVYYTINNTFSVDEDSKYILNGCPVGGASNTYCLAYYEWNSSWSQKVRNIDAGNGIVLNHSSESSIYQVRIVIAKGTSCNNLVFKPMIRLASITDSTYEPYQSQTVNLSAPIELHGLGDVKDRIVKKNGVFGVDRRINKYIFTGEESWIKSSLLIDGYSSFYCQNLVSDIVENSNKLCTHFVNADNADWSNLVATEFIQNPYGAGKNSVGIRVLTRKLVSDDVDGFKTFLKNNDISFIYELATPIFEPLPQADIDAIKALHSYKPNTVVMNDADAEMDVHYVADAKSYIDKKFEALASAIVNQ